MKLSLEYWPRYLLFILVATATFYFLYLVNDVVITFSLGAILAYLLYHPVAFLERKGLKRSYCILIIYILVFVLVGIALYWLVPSLVKEAGNLVDMYPQLVEKAEEISAEIDGMDKPKEIDKLIANNITRIQKGLYQGLQAFISSIYFLVGKIFSIVLAPILSFYILIDWEKIRYGFLCLFTPRFRRELRVLAADIDKVLIEGIKGSLLVAIIVGVLVGLSALLLGVKFPLLIGLLSGITNLIPFFGPIIGGIPAVALAYTSSFKLAVYQAIALVVIQQLESNFITPRILGGKLGMHPLLIIFSLLAGGSLFGVWGILFAVPAAASIKVTLSWLYLRFAS
jgi:predicted PurR-regulated permease PerM